jgi:hypothetical protein
MKILSWLIVSAISALTIGLFYMMYVDGQKEKKLSREEILEKAREAKSIKKILRDEEPSQSVTEE